MPVGVREVDPRAPTALTLSFTLNLDAPSPPPRPFGPHTDTPTCAFHARAAHRTRPTRQLTLNRHGTPRALAQKYVLYFSSRYTHTPDVTVQTSTPTCLMSHLPCVVYTVSWPHTSLVRWPHTQHTATHGNTQHTIHIYHSQYRVVRSWVARRPPARTIPLPYPYQAPGAQ